MTDRLRIRGGRVVDPVQGLAGEVRDVCLENGVIVERLPEDAPVLEAGGLVVMAGGVDLHAHVAGPKVNLARRLQPERARAGAATVPTSLDTGRLYASLGYTTVMDAAVPFLGARQAHLELEDTPILDKGFYVLAGDDAFVSDALAAGEDERARETLAFMVRAAGAYGVKVVAPGSMGSGLDARRILTAVAAAVEELRLPHPMHLHANDLGVAGNAATTLATMDALDGRRAHLAHLQFHSYGGEAGARPTSRARDVVEALSRHENLSADVGQVMFGPATVMTADQAAAERLHDLLGRKWVAADLELERGCGVLPFEYRETNLVHATQWAVGLELLLLSADPWRLVLSTDHPNGGTFLSYPRLIRLLMDKAFRDEQIARLPPRALEGTALADGLSREYTLSEIAIVTRAGPARLLGLAGKGHLGPGADADVALYAEDADVEAMFRAPRYVFKAGRRVVTDGRVDPRVREAIGAKAEAAARGRTHRSAPEYDPSVERSLRRLLDREGTLTLEDYVVRPQEAS